MDRLATVASALVSELTAASPDQLRRVALAAAEAATAQTGLSDPRLDGARRAVAEAQFGSSGELEALESLVAELDEAQWNLKDELEEGKVLLGVHLAAFRKARAAGAWVFVLDADARRAAMEATYEAFTAIDDLDALSGVVRQALTG